MLPGITAGAVYNPDTYKALILADSPLAYWPCQDSRASTGAEDVSGNGHHLTAVSTMVKACYAKNPRMGKAISFSTTGYLSHAADPWFQLLGDFTLECWAHLEVLPTSSNQVFFFQVAENNELATGNILMHFGLQNNSGTMRLRALHESGAGVDNQVVFNYTPPLRKWVHYALERDVSANEYTFYINGVAVSTGSFTNDPTGGSTSLFGINRSHAGSNASDVRTRICHAAMYTSRLGATKLAKRVAFMGGDPSPLWENTTLMCRFQGTDGQTTLLDDDSSFGCKLDQRGNVQLDTDQAPFGGTSLLLDGTGDFLEGTDTSIHEITNNQFTVEAVVRINATGRVHTILSKRDGTGAEEFTLSIDASNHAAFEAFASGSAVVSLTGTSALTTGVWYHICAQRIASDVWTLHVNGVLEDSDTVSTTATTNSQGICVGRDGSNTSRDFAGWIGSVRMTHTMARYGAGNFSPPVALFAPYT